MKTLSSYIRVIVIVTLVFFALEYMIDAGDRPAFLKYPEVIIFIVLFTVILVAVEVIVSSMNTLAETIMTEEQKAALAEKKALRAANAWYRKLYKQLTRSKPVEEEGEIILDHNYDGIKELDNALPPWWLYGFYFTILVSVIYLARYHIFDGMTQGQEYEVEVAEAAKAIEEYKKTAKDLVDVNTVVLLTDASDLSAGKSIFQANCVVCHMADGGGGIGPNLTDEYWVLGGGIKNVFNTISEGGRSGKGMVAWKQSLKPSEMQQVASYVLTFQGTTPANPKDPEGEIWVDEEAEEQDVTPPEGGEVVKDTVSVAMNRP